MDSKSLSVAAWIEDLQSPSDVLPEFIDELRTFLDDRARDATSGLEEGLVPLRLLKSRIVSLERCERLALAEASESRAPEPMTAERFRGNALDLFVIHQLAAGRALDPTEVIRSMAAAEGDAALLDYMETVEAGDDGALGAVLDPLATVVADSWSDIAAAWVPRTQTRASAVFDEGSVICTGRLDVELGGVISGRPGVVVEVKSGQPRQEHAAEVYFYALLVALRDRRAPAAVLRWYPGAAPAISPVSAEVLESVAVRIVDSMSAWARLVAGSAAARDQSDFAARESPGAWCNWCPDAAVCPSAGSG